MKFDGLIITSPINNTVQEMLYKCNAKYDKSYHQFIINSENLAEFLKGFEITQLYKVYFHYCSLTLLKVKQMARPTEYIPTDADKQKVLRLKVFSSIDDIVKDSGLTEHYVKQILKEAKEKTYNATDSYTVDDSKKIDKQIAYATDAELRDIYSHFNDVADLTIMSILRANGSKRSIGYEMFLDASRGGVKDAFFLDGNFKKQEQIDIMNEQRKVYQINRIIGDRAYRIFLNSVHSPISLANRWSCQSNLCDKRFGTKKIIYNQLARLSRVYGIPLNTFLKREYWDFVKELYVFYLQRKGWTCYQVTLINDVNGKQVTITNKMGKRTFEGVMRIFENVNLGINKDITVELTPLVQ